MFDANQKDSSHGGRVLLTKQVSIGDLFSANELLDVINEILWDDMLPSEIPQPLDKNGQRCNGAEEDRIHEDPPFGEEIEHGLTLRTHVGNLSQLFRYSNSMGWAWN